MNRRSMRAAALALAAVLTAALTAAVAWRLHPGRPVDGADPDTDIVELCAWIGWAVATYLCLATAAAAARHLGRCGRPLAALAPPLLQHVVDAIVTAGVVAAVAGSSVSATAATGHRAATGPGRPATLASALDWPGLPAYPGRPAPPDDDGVLVRPGDTLWTIAARALGPDPSAARVAASWPRWYATNRELIGADPNLIRPGQRLRPPAATARSPR